METPTLTIFANFRIDSEERLLRMKDSFASFKGIASQRWLVNVRGPFKEQARAFLLAQPGLPLVMFDLESPEGWFHDSRTMAAEIDTTFVLYWIEDHLCVAQDLGIFRSILADMQASGVDFLPYSFFWTTDRYRLIEKKELDSIDWLDLDLDNFKLLQRAAPEAYIIFATGIFSASLFKKVLFTDDTEQAICWPAETPFNFEKSAHDVHWLPFRVGLPKRELFASIDDDSVAPGTCLISRGLYTPRKPRRTMGASESYSPESATPANKADGAAKDDMNRLSVYDEGFYEEQKSASLRSAEAIVPILMETFAPASVIDVGCGVGGWLQVFQRHGVANICGYDASDLSADKYFIDKRHIFTGLDLASPTFRIQQQADLLLCLEVAEHLPHETADAFVRTLAGAAPVVIFSAALPGQTGVNHVNEQPPWYWRERFNKAGYMELDFLRPRLLRNEDVCWWYRQNITCFIHPGRLSADPALAGLARLHGQGDSVHKLTVVNEWVLRNLLANRGVDPQPFEASTGAPLLSVIIPTCNRAPLLYNALESISRQTCPEELFEVIVVNNGSSDETEEVCRHFSRRITHFKIISEPRPGLHNGRHAGMKEARGEVLVYADDDIEALPTWLEGVAESFRDPAVALVGGKILPKFEAAPPEWVATLSHNTDAGWALGWYSLLDFGDTVHEIPHEYVWGCNLSIRRDVLLKAGGFHPDAFPQVLIRYRGDGETALSEAVRRMGLKCLYNPKASVRHVVTKERMTLEYIYRRAYNQGISDSFTDLRRTRRLSPERSFERRGNEAHDAVVRGLTDGYNYHQKLYAQDPALRQWVLQDEYITNGGIPA
ncbi:MAG: glycosyltransferase [Geobacter sp.]|nr:MAG: glycosyltransferase [Geobacter sp.]